MRVGRRGRAECRLPQFVESREFVWVVLLGVFCRESQFISRNHHCANLGAVWPERRCAPQSPLIRPQHNIAVKLHVMCHNMPATGHGLLELLEHIRERHTACQCIIHGNPVDFGGIRGNKPALWLNDVRLFGQSHGPRLSDFAENPGNTDEVRPVAAGKHGVQVFVFGKTSGLRVEE